VVIFNTLKGILMRVLKRILNPLFSNYARPSILSPSLSSSYWYSTSSSGPPLIGIGQLYLKTTGLNIFSAGYASILGKILQNTCCPQKVKCLLFLFKQSFFSFSNNLNIKLLSQASNEINEILSPFLNCTKIMINIYLFSLK
jgi:hypothetical protein